MLTVRCIYRIIQRRAQVIFKYEHLSTYVAFIDFSKAYDRINRNLMWSKLERMGVAPTFMCALKSLYKDVKCSVKLNGIMSEFLV